MRTKRGTTCVVEFVFLAARIYWVGLVRLMLVALALPYIISKVAEARSGTILQRLRDAVGSLKEAWEKAWEL